MRNYYFYEHMFFLQVIYPGSERAERINLWPHNNHFDIIKSLTGFYGSNFYCLSCNVAYQNETSHMCSSRCYVCLRDKCSVTEEIRCNECERVCRSIECYECHKDTSGQKVLSICDKVISFFQLISFVLSIIN